LERLGALVHGLALRPDTDPSLFELLQPFARLTSELGDVRDLDRVAAAVRKCNPTIAIHMAAQPLVRRSFALPVETMATNIMGTVHVLEALRQATALKAVLVVTTDKVYRSNNSHGAFVESDRVGGEDPYSASKAAAELVAQSWAASFLRVRDVSVATARAGNVIGGGDWSEDRIVPDVWRAIRAGRPVALRYPDAVRPWQHVLDALCGYLLFVERLAEGADLPTSLNFGPLEKSELTVGELVDEILRHMERPIGWIKTEATLPEMEQLELDSTLAVRTLGWAPRLIGAKAVAFTADWYHALDMGADPRRLTLDQIAAYEVIAA
jgi:CDP-glucose 4,6-dehydratase